MKVLVFPALLAISIITGPPKTSTSPATSAALVKSQTTTVASLKPEQTALPAPDAPAAPMKAPLGDR